MQVKVKLMTLAIISLFSAMAFAAPVMARPTVNNIKYTEYGKIFGPWNYPDTTQGPGKFYGQPVRIKYECTNRWTITERDRDGDGTLDWVRWHYTHVGTAEVYGAGLDGVLGTGDDVLLDTRPFTCSQTVVDDGIDASARYGPTPSTTDPSLMIIYYLLTYPPSPYPKLEFMDYEWIIGGGVYHFHVIVVNGQILQWTVSP